MPETIEVVYEGGVFKPFKKIDLEEGVRGEVTIKGKGLKRFRGIVKKPPGLREEELVEALHE